MNKQLDELERATLQYLTKDNLPTVINSSKTIRLKILINNGISQGIKDQDGNRCDTSESYSEVTKLDNNYSVKMSLSCSNNEATRVIYIGCFQECNGEICKATLGSTNGICTITPTVPDKDKNNNSNTSKPKPIKPNKPGNGNSNNDSNGNNNNGNNNNNGSNNGGNGNNNIKPPIQNKVTLYEYKKCSQTPYCTVGSYNSSLNRCEQRIEKTLYGDILTLGDGTTTKIVGTPTVTKIPEVVGTPVSKKVSKVVGTVSKTTIYTKNSSTIKNTSSINYKFIRYDVSKGYVYEKTSCKTGNISGSSCVTYTTSTTCSEGEILGNSCVIYNTTKTCGYGEVSGNNCVIKEQKPVTYTCSDNSYFYNKYSHTCTKVGYDIKKYKPNFTSNCQTTWSKSPILVGWTRTGNTKIVLE